MVLVQLDSDRTPGGAWANLEVVTSPLEGVMKPPCVRSSEAWVACAGLSWRDRRRRLAAALITSFRDRAKPYGVSQHQGRMAFQSRWTIS